MANAPGSDTSNSISGGTQQGPVVQAHTINEVRVNAPTSPAPSVAPAQLPPLIAEFTGRYNELESMIRLLDPAGDAGTVVVSAVAGLAGVGKTSLAVQAGHVAREKGWFAGGVFFVDLHGYDEIPVSSEEALNMLLRALDVPAKKMPPTVDERAALYRSKLAGIGKPVLLIVDNASSEPQVQPLLPGPGPHRVIITSRHTLAGLGARLLDLTVLDEQAALALLDAALRLARPSDDRISSNPKAAKRLTAICSGLPLALHITAAILKSDPDLSSEELANELTASQNRLAALRYGDDSGGHVRSVEAAFSLSYARLEKTSARVFRLISVNPDDDVSTEAASVMADLPAIDTRKVLRTLARAHLIEAAPGAAGQWRMHDLVRLYGKWLSVGNADADGRDQAVGRLIEHSKIPQSSARLQRLTVNLVPRATRDLEQAMTKMKGDSKTDIVNRAISVYNYIEQLSSSDSRIYIKTSDESEWRELKLF
jgi:hypothetical protein